MLSEISKEICGLINSFPQEDSLIFGNRLIQFNQQNFRPIVKCTSAKKIAFIDGGQAEIVSAGNFCLSFIRLFCQVFDGQARTESFKNEFYLFARLKNIGGRIFCQGKVFCSGKAVIEEADLIIPVSELVIPGEERTASLKMSNLARRLAELSLAKKMAEKTDFVLLDGTLESRFKCEEKTIASLPENVSALAKTSSLFTVSGNSPNLLLNRLEPKSCWQYPLSEKMHFVKLHEKAGHVFRFEGSPEILPYLAENSQDALFLGYPYGLIFADKMARVSNEEKKSLKINFLLRKENQEILDYLNSVNAHEILDSLG